MKNFILVLALFLSSLSFAQITHNVDGKDTQLTEEITGKASLFYAVIDGTHRYFIKKDGQITELTNTKDENGKYQQEYKEILNIITADKAQDASNIKLTLGDLASFTDNYNVAADINYKMQKERPVTKARLGVFMGMSNNPFVSNPENIFVPTFGIEGEVYDEKRSRHSIVLQLKQSLKSSDFDYTSTQASFNYRFRIINKEKFTLYPQIKFATFTYTKSGAESATNFDGPVIFGIGSDIKLGKGYLTLSYDEIAALFLDNQGNFPMDFRLGYKFNL